MPIPLFIICLVIFTSCTQTPKPNFTSIENSLPEDLPRLVHLHNFDSARIVLDHGELGYTLQDSVIDFYAKNKNQVVHYNYSPSIDSPNKIFTYNEEHQLTSLKYWIDYDYSYKVKQDKILKVSNYESLEIHHNDTTFYYFKDGKLNEHFTHYKTPGYYTYNTHGQLIEIQNYFHEKLILMTGDSLEHIHFTYDENILTHTTKTYSYIRIITTYNPSGLPIKQFHLNLENDTDYVFRYEYFKTGEKLNL